MKMHSPDSRLKTCNTTSKFPCTCTNEITNGLQLKVSNICMCRFILLIWLRPLLKKTFSLIKQCRSTDEAKFLKAFQMRAEKNCNLQFWTYLLFRPECSVFRGTCVFRRASKQNISSRLWSWRVSLPKSISSQSDPNSSIQRSKGVVCYHARGWNLGRIVETMLRSIWVTACYSLSH